MKKVNCILCGSIEYKVLLTTKDNRYYLSSNFRLVQCNNCGLIYLNPMPNADEISEFYPKDVYYNQSVASKIYSKVLGYAKYYKITQYKEKGKILDVGCGTGDLLLLFKNKNWDTYGVEISGVGYQITNEKLKSNIYNCELKECQFPDNHFDVVVLNHVLEHLLYPLEESKEIHRILKPEGVLYVSVPNIESLQFKYTKENWFHIDIPRHVYHYSPRTIEELLEKNGFSLVRITYGLFDFPLDLFHSASAKWLSSHSKLFRVIFYLPLFFISVIKLFPKWRGTMEVIAQKHVE